MADFFNDKTVGDAGWTRQQHGAIILDGQEVASTMQCCHCGNHFIVRRGSGVQRGFCLGCMGVTCGEPGCHVCLPFEKRLDLAEKGLLTHV